MKKLRKRETDLLINRRKESNSIKLTYTYIKGLRRKGFLIGGLITLATLTGCVYLGYETYSKIQYRKEITTEANKYAALKTTYKKLR